MSFLGLVIVKRYGNCLFWARNPALLGVGVDLKDMSLARKNRWFPGKNNGKISQEPCLTLPKVINILWPSNKLPHQQMKKIKSSSNQCLLWRCAETRSAAIKLTLFSTTTTLASDLLLPHATVSVKKYLILMSSNFSSHFLFYQSSVNLHWEDKTLQINQSVSNKTALVGQ